MQVRFVKWANGSAAADRCRLDHPALRRRREQRHEAIVGKIDVVERMILVLQDGSRLQRDDVQMPRKQSQIGLRQTREHVVLVAPRAGRFREAACGFSPAPAAWIPVLNAGGFHPWGFWRSPIRLVVPRIGRPPANAQHARRRMREFIPKAKQVVRKNRDRIRALPFRRERDRSPATDAWPPVVVTQAYAQSGCRQSKYSWDPREPRSSAVTGDAPHPIHCPGGEPLLLGRPAHHGFVQAGRIAFAGPRRVDDHARDDIGQRVGGLGEASSAALAMPR